MGEILDLSVLTSLVEVLDPAIILLLGEIVHLKRPLRIVKRYHKKRENDANKSIILRTISRTSSYMRRLIVSTLQVHTLCPVIIMFAPHVVVAKYERLMRGSTNWCLI